MNESIGADVSTTAEIDIQMLLQGKVLETPWYRLFPYNTGAAQYDCSSEIAGVSSIEYRATNKDRKNSVTYPIYSVLDLEIRFLRVILQQITASPVST